MPREKKRTIASLAQKPISCFSVWTATVYTAVRPMDLKNGTFVAKLDLRSAF